MSEAVLTGFSPYDDTGLIDRHVRDGQHRAVIGGFWEELGGLQRDFLIGRGLRRDDVFIDMGAGSFRAGVKLVPYLDPSNYYAVDSQATLMDAGYRNEIVRLGLADRFPRGNIHATRDFDVSGFRRVFDMGIAQSVFTHMPASRVLDCLAALAPHFRVGGRFYVTFFIVEGSVRDRPVLHAKGGVTTHPAQDPFHTTDADLMAIGAKLSDWDMTILGDWSHPRDQQMVEFTKRGA